MTQEMKLGTNGNTKIGSSGLCTLDGCEYRDQGDHKSGTIYLQGSWHDAEDHVEFKGEQNKGYLTIIHNGTIKIKLEGDTEIEGADNHSKENNILTITIKEEKEVKLLPTNGTKIFSVVLS
jgi:hypothetical protein